MISRDGYAYTEPISTMVMHLNVLVPADGHPPLILGSIVGADYYVCDLDRRTGAYLLQKFAYTVHDFANVDVV